MNIEIKDLNDKEVIVSKEDLFNFIDEIHGYLDQIEELNEEIDDLNEMILAQKEVISKIANIK
jgi:prefoldin subunit 5